MRSALINIMLACILTATNFIITAFSFFYNIFFFFKKNMIWEMTAKNFNLRNFTTYTCIQIGAQMS